MADHSALTFHRWHVPLLLGVAALLFGTRLTCPLLEPEETRYAEIPRQMLAQGRFVEPVWHGEPYYHKPPLLYWLVMASYRAFGVGDGAARLVPALAAVLTVLVVYGWARAVAGPGTGFAAALLLCLSARFVYLGRMVVIDGLLGLWVVAALAAAHLALRGGGWRWWLASAACCGLGVLTKGPVALALVLPPVAVLALYRQGRGAVGRLALYVAVAGTVAAPWFAAVACIAPDAAADFFWLHNVRRYVAPFDHAKPWWFYLPLLLTGTLPWSLLAVPPAYRLLTRRDQPWPPGLRFWALAAGWALLFFSASGCKRAAYLLPALPLFALVLGALLAPALAAASRPRRVAWGLGLVTTGVVLAVGVLEGLPDYHRRFALRGVVRRHRDLDPDGTLAVYCYPKRWDSVSFYLGRDDVRVFTADQRSELVGALARRPRALVFVKTAGHLDDLRAALPPALEFVPCGRQAGHVAVGLVRPR